MAKTKSESELPVTGVFLKKDKKSVFTLDCNVNKNAVLLFVTPNKKVQKCSDANFGKNEIVINEKSVDIILKGNETELKEENNFTLWHQGNKGYVKLIVGKIK